MSWYGASGSCKSPFGQENSDVRPRLQLLETLVIGDVVAKHDLSNPLLSHLDGVPITEWDLLEF